MRQLNDSRMNSVNGSSFDSKGLKVNLGNTKVMVTGGIRKGGLYIYMKFTHMGSVV